MSKQAKTILIGWIGMVPLAVMIIFVLLQHLGVLEAHAAPVEDFTVEETEAVNEADFDENSAMPCIDREAFRRFLETYEPETGEKEIQETICIDAGRTGDGDPQIAQPGSNENIHGRGGEDCRSSDGGDPENDRDPEEPRLYMIAGKLIDPEIQRTLWEHLNAAGIGYWYEGALAQMYQESSCDPYQVTNGLDYGIFQYRITFWNWDDGDIFDVDAQMSRYASEMAARFNSGLSVDEAISRHMTSDFVSTINREYVSDVKRWLSEMEVVE